MTTNVGEDVRQEELSYTACRNKAGTMTMETSVDSPHKTQNRIAM